MVTKVTSGRRAERVVQFSVFTPNRLGRLHELVGALGSQNVHMLALTVLDTTDSAIIRFVADDPDSTRDLLEKNGYPFTESEIVAVEVASATELQRLMAALHQAELNVNYLYSFIPHPHGKSIIALSMEDNETAEEALQKQQFRTLKQSDVSR